MTSLENTKYGYFSENLPLLRRDRHLTQIKLASSIGVTNKTISDWENGIKEPRETMFIKVCDFFNISPDYMCNYRYSPETRTWNSKIATNIPKSCYNASQDNISDKKIDFDTLDTTLQLYMLINKLSEYDKKLLLQISKRLFNLSNGNLSMIEATNNELDSTETFINEDEND